MFGYGRCLIYQGTRSITHRGSVLIRSYTTNFLLLFPHNQLLKNPWFFTLKCKVILILEFAHRCSIPGCTAIKTKVKVSQVLGSFSAQDGQKFNFLQLCDATPYKHALFANFVRAAVALVEVVLPRK
jgi:hypothetical protein